MNSYKEISSKWEKFKKGRWLHELFNHSHDHFLTMNQREQMIEDLLLIIQKIKK